MPYAAFLHSHVSSWAVMLVLFFVSYFFATQQKEKAQKITHMILRLFYILVIVTGVGLLVKLNFVTVGIVKAGLAVIAIGLMEAVLGNAKRGTPKPALLIAAIVLLAAVIYIGYSLIG